jgi:hypothetical protein
MDARRLGDAEREATQHTLTNTGALAVSVDRDKGGNGIPRRV